MITEELGFVIVLYMVIFLYGIVIGSFLNVCILRTPLRQSIAKERSHCMSCGYQLAWFDLVPLFSYLFLGGKCRKCKKHISAQYPVIEGLNGLLYVSIFLVNGWSIDSIIYCLFTSALVVLMVIDYRVREVSLGGNIFILALGLINLGLHLGDWVTYVVGLFAVSVIGFGCMLLSKGKLANLDEAILFSVIGFVIGYKKALLAIGFTIVISVLFLLIGKISKKKKINFAIGTCLTVGSYLAVMTSNWILK